MTTALPRWRTRQTWRQVQHIYLLSPERHILCCSRGKFGRSSQSLHDGRRAGSEGEFVGSALATLGIPGSSYGFRYYKLLLKVNVGVVQPRGSLFPWWRMFQSCREVLGELGLHTGDLRRFQRLFYVGLNYSFSYEPIRVYFLATWPPAKDVLVLGKNSWITVFGLPPDPILFTSPLAHPPLAFSEWGSSLNTRQLIHFRCAPPRSCCGEDSCHSPKYWYCRSCSSCYDKISRNE